MVKTPSRNWENTIDEEIKQPNEVPESSETTRTDLMVTIGDRDEIEREQIVLLVQLLKQQLAKAIGVIQWKETKIVRGWKSWFLFRCCCGTPLFLNFATRSNFRGHQTQILITLNALKVILERTSSYVTHLNNINMHIRDDCVVHHNDIQDDEIAGDVLSNWFRTTARTMALFDPK
jgi:hypothetical protein